MVRFVVQDQDVLQPHQIRHEPLEHLPFGFERVQLVADAPLEERPPSRRKLYPLAAFKRVEVRDDDLGAIDVVQHVARHQLAARVVAVRVVRLEDAQPVLDGDAGGHDEEAAREALALWVPDSVNGLPCDEHGHDGGLPRAGRELEGQSHELRIRVVVRVHEVLEDGLDVLSEIRRHFGQPDGGLRRLDLAEERPHTGKRVVSPVLKQARRLGRDVPVVRVRQTPPGVDTLANRLDECVLLVLLGRSRQALAFVEDEAGLLLVLLRLRNRGDEFGVTPRLDDPLGRLPVLVQLPVAGGVGVRRIEDGALEEGVGRGIASRHLVEGYPFSWFPADEAAAIGLSRGSSRLLE